VANRSAVSYVPPVRRVRGAVGRRRRPNDNEFFAGAASASRSLPHQHRRARRGQLGYGFDNEAARIGLNLGLSFFTRRAQ
jgi:hypothetical protein